MANLMRTRVIFAVATMLLTGTGVRIATARSASPVPPRCTAAQLVTWIGVGGPSTTMGSTYYALEFSNVSHHACRLSGTPKIKAEVIGSNSFPQLGETTPGTTRGKIVVLKPRATATIQLVVADPLFICDKPKQSFDELVWPPGNADSDDLHADEIVFQWKICPHAGAFGTYGLRLGVGIPAGGPPS